MKCLVYGHLLTFGYNKSGQLGLGDFRTHRYINIIGGELSGKIVCKVACGDDFTVAATSGNHSS